jgi:hypothetical protein
MSLVCALLALRRILRPAAGCLDRPAHRVTHGRAVTTRSSFREPSLPTPEGIGRQRMVLPTRLQPTSSLAFRIASVAHRSDFSGGAQRLRYGAR